MYIESRIEELRLNIEKANNNNHKRNLQAELDILSFLPSDGIPKKFNKRYGTTDIYRYSWDKLTYEEQNHYEAITDASWMYDLKTVANLFPFIQLHEHGNAYRILNYCNLYVCGQTQPTNTQYRICGEALNEAHWRIFRKMKKLYDEGISIPVIRGKVMSIHYNIDVDYLIQEIQVEGKY